MNRRQKIIVSVTGIFLVLLLLVGLTYAYFLTRITGNTNTKSISVSTANLALVYGDGNRTITGDKIQPGTTLDTKTFTVKNEGNAKTDYVVVIENVSVTYAETIEVEGVTQTTGESTTFESNDFVYTLTCTSDGEACNGVDTEVTFPITGGILVGNSIEVGKTHTYSLTVTYKETGIDQSNDMNKTLTAKVNIADPNGFNPYVGDKTTLAYNIINNAIALTNEERNAGYAELRATPLTTPAVETTMLYTDNGAGTESTKNYVSTKTFTTTNAAKYYITYGDTYSYTTNYTITNKDSSSLQAVLVSTNYETLKGKYIVSYSGSTSSTPVSGSGKSSIYYVTNTKSDDSGVTIEYLTLSGGLASNEKYITYGDSYKFNANTGTYTLNNVKVVKYSEGYKTLIGKYIVNTSGANSSTAATSTNLSWIYLVTGNSTETAMAYKAVTKKTTEDSYGSAESTLSMTPDEYGTSYYYRGAVKNNYLSFNNMCWRIVRINGDGSTKLILEDQDQPCSEDINGNWDIPTTTGGTTKTGNFGYTEYAKETLTASDGTTKNSSTRYLMDYLHGQTNSASSMATAFKNFQSTFTETELSKLKSGNWCLNDTAYDSSNNLLNSTQIMDNKIKRTSFNYDSLVRLYNNSPKQPTLKCNGTIMNDWDDDANNPTPMYIGTLTADEIVYAGGKVYTSNQNYYLINNYQKSKTKYFWSLSPNYFYGSNDFAFYVSDDGRLGHYDVDDYRDSFRPSVSLASSAVITSGEGTLENPYVIG